MILSRIFLYPVARSWQSHLKESCIVLVHFLDKVLAWILARSYVFLVRSEMVLSKSWQETCQDLITFTYKLCAHSYWFSMNLGKILRISRKIWNGLVKTLSLSHTSPVHILGKFLLESLKENKLGLGKSLTRSCIKTGKILVIVEKIMRCMNVE